MSRSQQRRKAIQRRGKLHAFIQEQVEKAKPFEDRLFDTLVKMVLEAFEKGEDIPPIPVLADQLGTSATTCTKALKRLVAKDRVVRVGVSLYTRYIPKIPEFFEE